MTKRTVGRTAGASVSAAGGNRVGRIGARRLAPRASPSVHEPSIIERDGAFFWRDSETGGLIGPFTTLKAAAADRDSPESLVGEILDAIGADDLHEAETQMGIDDFIDPDTGEPLHGYQPHVRDDH